jgi:hypothetical protein
VINAKEISHFAINFSLCCTPEDMGEFCAYPARGANAKFSRLHRLFSEEFGTEQLK